jgi:hypothetical protein
MTLKEFENRVVRGVFRPDREEETGGCRKLHNLYSLLNIISHIIRSSRIR